MIMICTSCHLRHAGLLYTVELRNPGHANLFCMTTENTNTITQPHNVKKIEFKKFHEKCVVANVLCIVRHDIVGM